MRVGIPRALFYYNFFPQWKSFFNNLGREVVTSAPTHKAMANAGILSAVSEACFPVKLFYGHILDLNGQEVDWIFAPRLVSIERRSYICPKFMGIPDMLRAQIPALRPLIDIRIDVSRDERELFRELDKLAKKVGLKPSHVRRAWVDSTRASQSLDSICRQGNSLDEGIGIWEGQPVLKSGPGELNIGILGHCYTLNDRFISLGIFDRLREMGAATVTTEMLDPSQVDEAASTLPKRVFWTVGRNMVGTALLLNQAEDIDGLIYMACFGCGPDSMMAKVIERRMNKPFMLLTVDEHSGEAGIVTRLEAFCDMLRRRRRSLHENNLPAYGEFLYSH
jgi:predicted nucleotide-binding protein (sugar kinase/HSP70/actin superfamily)